MRFHPARTAAAVLIGATVLSCSDSLTSIKRPGLGGIARDASGSIGPQIVISQVYGGGGNSGATITNDFIELHNRGGTAVSLTGWTVQYASANGTTWQRTDLTGSIAAGGYYLVQEAKGSGGTVSLTADAAGTIAMSATDGKVALVNGTAALSGACPTAVDIVTFGAVNNNLCSLPDATPKLSNTTAALRKDSGCQLTTSPSADFDVGAPAPRNAATPVHPCAGAIPVGSLDHLTVGQTTATVIVGKTLQLTATPQDANNQTIPSVTVTWVSSDDNIATVDNTGLVTGVAASASPVTLTAAATATDDNGNTITKQATVQLTVKLPGINWIDVSSSSTSFPPGFQTQVFFTARTQQNGEVIEADFTVEALDPQVAAVANVENTGIITGIAPQSGTTKPGFRITAVPKGGGDPYTFTTHPVTIEAATFAPASIYAANDEFGDPTDASTSNPNDLLIRRNQYVLSYNESRGTPNWVSYELDARQFGGEDRCNCFTADPNLPADKQILTADYTNGGFDRGHMTRSADRTKANGDNATTFYLTNVVPQQADLNQGVWAQFENALADSAQGGRAVYIITGPLYSASHGLTFLKNEGKVAIPDSTWKIALIGPADGGNPFTRASLQSWNDLAGVTILAVNMPNVAGVRNDPWSKYLTSVHRIEKSTGYDFLSLLQMPFQDALEAGDHAPSARYAIAGAPNEGSALTFDASASADPDLGRTDLGRAEALSYRWQFSDGATATGPSTTHLFARFGTYTATLTVTDAFGWPSTSSQTITVNDVAPAVAALPNASLITGEQYVASGSFADPGLDSWSASIDYGDGNGAEGLSLDGNRFSLQHVYSSPGEFTLAVRVADDGGKQGTSTATVTVETPLSATQDLIAEVQSLGQAQSIALAGGSAAAPQLVQPLLASLDAAVRQIQAGKNVPAANELGAFINKVNAAAMTGRLPVATAQQMTSLAARVQRALVG